MPNRPASMRDVARRAEVSLSTASCVLRGAPVAPAVPHKVRAAADDFSYTVSRNASGVVTGRTCRVAIVVPSLRPWYFAPMVSGLGHALREVVSHLTADLLQSRRPPDTRVELPSQIVPRQSTAAPRERRTSHEEPNRRAPHVPMVARCRAVSGLPAQLHRLRRRRGR